jgi:beta-1,4-mannosyl-glycoprotein beta-1,4-N-acetylglucosaminyltransferase
MKKINPINNSKVFDCITFFRENLITNLRFEILNDVVDYFIVCESLYDHRGKKKKINFKIINKKLKKKIIHIVIKKKFNTTNPWKAQALQREYIFEGIKNADDNDYIMFSDPDEIPNPAILKKIILKKKYGIFMQSSFCYKFNLFNKYETPWEGTRICKKKNLRSIDYMRQKILLKNLKYSFWRIDKNKDIQIINNGGWHFNNILSPKEISIKLKTFAHTEFSNPKFSSIKTIKEKIAKKIDLYNRGWFFTKININKTFPKNIVNKLNKFRDLIL